VIVTAVVLFAASPAWAGTVSITGSGSDKTIVFDAAPLEKNSIRVIQFEGSSDVELDDLYGVTVTAGAGCTQGTTPGIQAVYCPAAGVSSIVLNLGDGGDYGFGAGSTIPIVANGGPGDDGFTGGDEPDTFNGGDGNDTYSDGFQADIGAPDTFSGGPGEDNAYLTERSDPLNISLDGVANDGAPGEDDNIEADVEDVTGGTGGDTITGSDSANHLDGWDGADHVDGQGGDDVIAERGCEADTVLGGAGNDDLNAGGGEGDTIDGGPGDDTIHDEHRCTSAGDTLSGGSGTDLLLYGGAVQGMSVTLNDVSDDGVPGENDNVESDIENVTGGGYADYIEGDSADNVLNGAGADDVIIGGGGNDTLQGSIGDDVLDGGPGADTLEGDAGEDVADYASRTQPVTVDLDGQTGDDGEVGEGDTVESDVEDVWGGSGDDVLTGNASDNAFDGGPGADQMDGLGGEDLADYSTRTQPVSASIDGVANDGEAGEGDNIATDIEDLRGGSGSDTLTGNDSDNVLDGGLGADQMFGGGGLDTVDYSDRTEPVTADLSGSPGNDGEAGEGDTIAADIEALIGGTGDDTLTGNPADGALIGGDGDDTLIDPGGSDYVDGGDGDDNLQTRDGAADQDTCGFGMDRVVGDPIDSVTDDCESVDGPPQPPGSGEGGGGTGGSGGTPTPHPRPPHPIIRPRPIGTIRDHTAPNGSLVIPNTLRLAALLRHGLTLSVGCDESCAINATLVATKISARRAHAAGRTLARRALPLASASPRRVTLRLTHGGRRLLRNARSATLRLAITLTDASGNRHTQWRSLHVR
jgi:Ca2+-binding RTX toxin-like protein